MLSSARCIICLGYALCTLSLISGFKEDGEDYNYDDYNGNGSELYEEVPAINSVKVPVFLTKPKQILVNEGSTIKLPCVFEELDKGFTVMWKQNGQIVALGDKPYQTEDKRKKINKMKNGNMFVIMMAEEKDAGKYTCQVSTTEESGITHEVKIRVKPVIVSVPSNGLVTVHAGKPAELGCEVTRGSPKPEITWKRKERRMSSGEEALDGKKKIKFLSTTRHHSGIYICLADNKWGTPSMAKIRLDVQHPPEIEDEQMLVENRDGGNDLEITCTVHASPVAKVTWIKDGEVMINKDNVITVRGNKHNLLLHEVYKVDRSGTYKCKAVNLLGVAEVVNEVTKEGNVRKVQTVSHQHQMAVNSEIVEPNILKHDINNINPTKDDLKTDDENKENVNIIVESNLYLKNMDKTEEPIVDSQINNDLIDKSGKLEEDIAQPEHQDSVTKVKLVNDPVDKSVSGIVEEHKNKSVLANAIETKKDDNMVNAEETNGKKTESDNDKNKSAVVTDDQQSAKQISDNPRQEKSTQSSSDTAFSCCLHTFVLLFVIFQYLI